MNMNKFLQKHGIKRQLKLNIREPATSGRRYWGHQPSKKADDVTDEAIASGSSVPGNDTPQEPSQDPLILFSAITTESDIILADAITSDVHSVRLESSIAAHDLEIPEISSQKTDSIIISEQQNQSHLLELTLDVTEANIIQNSESNTMNVNSESQESKKTISHTENEQTPSETTPITDTTPETELCQTPKLACIPIPKDISDSEEEDSDIELILLEELPTPRLTTPKKLSKSEFNKQMLRVAEEQSRLRRIEEGMGRQQEQEEKKRKRQEKRESFKSVVARQMEKDAEAMRLAEEKGEDEVVVVAKKQKVLVEEEEVRVSALVNTINESDDDEEMRDADGEEDEGQDSDGNILELPEVDESDDEISMIMDHVY